SDAPVEVEAPLYPYWADFSPDEKFLVVLGRGEGTGEGAVVRVRSGRPVSSFPAEHARDAAIHPSGAIVVGDALGKLVFVDLTAGVRALAHDVPGDRLLFGGLDGKIGFLDLATGRAGTLLDPPARPAVFDLGLSRDRRSLCCACRPEWFAQGKNRKPQLLQVW